MKKKLGLVICLSILSLIAESQTLAEKQMVNARATGYSIVATRNPGKNFAIYVIPWDGINTLEYNAIHQINPSWHAQAAVKGNYFDQSFVGNDFSTYSSVILSEEGFNQYKGNAGQWWIVCSNLPSFSNNNINVLANGNIGIGIALPSEKLAVNGTIHSKEVKVDLNGWADYVFKSDYNLPSLTEVKNYIDKNQHLPDLPSEEEVTKEGLKLGEINKLLTKKVEELTLYLIQQKEENDRIKEIQEKQYNTQQAQITELREQLSTIIKD